jgi:hypothetical protein
VIPDPHDPTFPYVMALAICASLFFLTCVGSLIFRRMERRDQKHWEEYLEKMKGTQ